MNERTQEAAQIALELRSRKLFEGSVERLDMRVRSRLARARHAALDEAASVQRRPWLFQFRIWTPAAGGVTAAVLLGAALWFGSPAGNHAITAAEQPGLEDLEIVATSEEGSGDAMEMLQNDLDFYDFADKATSSGPAV
jgi:hypothetical protein